MKCARCKEELKEFRWALVPFKDHIEQICAWCLIEMKVQIPEENEPIEPVFGPKKCDLCGEEKSHINLIGTKDGMVCYGCAVENDPEMTMRELV